jgi:hypothetical protein
MTSSSPFQPVSGAIATARPRSILDVPLGKALPFILLMMAAQAGILYAMGRVPICTCGAVKLWHGLLDSQNSQHVADWYSFSHVVHGILFYFLAWLFLPRSSVWLKLLIAVFLEAAWEIAENTPAIIERYRAATVSFDYVGDSIINSLGDTLAMIAGFLLAAILPAWASLGLLIALEVGLLFVIRDNMTLNVLMLVHPIDAIKQWQSGAAPPGS